MKMNAKIKKKKSWKSSRYHKSSWLSNNIILTQEQ